MIFCFRASSQAWVISNCVFYTLCCHTSLLLVDVVDPSGITGKYPSCCGRLNANAYRIRYRDGRMTSPSRPLNPPPRSLWTESAFIFSLKWASWMFWYVVSPSTLVIKGIVNEELISFAFDMVLDTLLLVESGSYLDAVWKRRFILAQIYFCGWR